MVWLLFASATSALAGSLAGVTVPDEVTVSGSPLVLNGLGLRERFMFDVFVGALYLPSRTTSAKEAIQPDVVKRIEMHFVYRRVDRDKLVGQFRSNMAKVPGHDSVVDEVDEFFSMMETMERGQVVRFDYVPGKGTTVTVKGVEKGTIEGADFMRVLWGNYLGEHPPTAALRRGMLGES